MSMKFALFDFFEENCIEVGESSWICDGDEDLGLPPLVMVEWQSSGNKRHRGKKFPAKVISFSDKREELVTLRNEMTNLSTKRPSSKSREQGPQGKVSNGVSAGEMGRGKRLPVKKRPFEDDLNSDDEEPCCNASRKVKECEDRMRDLEAELEKEKRGKYKYKKEAKNLSRTLTLIDNLPALLKRVETLSKGPPQLCSATEGSPGPSSSRFTSPTSPEQQQMPTGLITKDMLLRSNTKDPQKFTNDLMLCLWDEEHLATHSLTGSKSGREDNPAKTKKALDAKSIQAIVATVRIHFPERLPADIKSYMRQKLNNAAKQVQRKCQKGDV